MVLNGVEIVFNSVVRLNISPAMADFAPTGWDTCPASVALLTLLPFNVLLNATLSVVRVKVKYHKEVGHTQSVGQKSYSFYKAP